MRSDGIQGSGHVDTNPIFQKYAIPLALAQIFQQSTRAISQPEQQRGTTHAPRVGPGLSACTNGSAADMRYPNDLHPRFHPIPRLG